MAKKVVWNKHSLSFVRGLSVELKKEIGFLLNKLQLGEILKEPNSKPMKFIHPKGFELRIKDSSNAIRVIYVLFEKEIILIPHAFRKKSRSTPLKEIKLAKQRLKEML